MKVICEHCKRKFKMIQDMLQEKCLGSMLTETYYCCPKCGKKFVVCVMNAKCRELKRNMEAEIKKKLAITNSIEAVLQDKKIDNIQKEFKREMDKINGTKD